MSEPEMKTEAAPETEDFTDALSDEALDRWRGGDDRASGSCRCTLDCNAISEEDRMPMRRDT